MTAYKHLLKITLLGVWLSLANGSPDGLATIAQQANQPRRDRVHYELKEPPPTGNPPQTSGAGNRGSVGNCPSVEKPLTALVPQSNTSNGNFVWGRTLESRPTVWVYVPYALTSNRPGELRLKQKDAKGNGVNTPIARIIGTSPGVIGIRVSPHNPLEKNQTYYWSFVVLCDPNDPSANQFVKAGIQRVESSPSLTQQLKQAQTGERVAIYARSGLWYDALTQLASLRRSNPTNRTLSQDWNSLLGDAGLNGIASAAIVQAPQSTQ